MTLYAEFDTFKSLYGDNALAEKDYNRLAWEACRLIDNLTSGVDGIKKLRIAFPADENDAEAIRRCVCKLVDIANQIETMEKASNAARGFVEREDGTMISKKITSVSSGSESIHYASDTAAGSAISVAASDVSARNALYASTIREYLSGAKDANGVNLLYMGRYPYVLRHDNTL